MEVYFEINRALFEKCVKFNVCADPSTYGGHPLHTSAPPPINPHSHPPTLPISRSGGSGKDTTASLIYAWEVNHGCIGPACLTPAGKFCNPYEWEGMSDATLARVVTRKVERYKALKEWRTMSFICEQLTTCSLDDFRMPATCAIRQPKPNEQRIAKPSADGRSTTYVLRGDDGGETIVLPMSENPGDWKQLTACMDSGAVGRSAASFAKHHVGLFMFVVFDIIHRMIRDLKLAMEKVWQ